MRLNFIPLWGGLCLLFSAGGATAQTPVNTFAASANHSLSIHADGSLWAWGMNYEGQLGDGTRDCSAIPVQVLADSPETRWARVAAGTSHTLALTADGRLYAWGSNTDGQLGDGTTAGHLRPAAVKLPASAAHAVWQQVAAGTSHSLALSTDGRLFAWGNNNHGELGNGYTMDRATPVEVLLPPSAAHVTWAQVTAGTNHTLALTTDGHLYAWGGNEFGQLGSGSDPLSLQPMMVGLTRKLAGLRWAHVAAGNYHTLAVTVDGRLYAWGSNRFGQLGDAHNAQHNLPEPMQWPAGLARTAWKQVAAGAMHSVALTTDGRLYAWGNNCAGQLGNGGTAPKFSPVAVGQPLNSTSVVWTQVVSAGFHTLATTADGRFCAWGTNRYGQLGDGTTTDRCRPMAQDPALTLRAEPGHATITRAKAIAPVEEWGLNDDRLMNELPPTPSFIIRPEPAANDPF